VLAVAQVAAIMAAKRTHEIVPMCHPLLLTAIDCAFALGADGRSIEITARVETRGQTGVEMEALTAVTAAALTIYDMVKAIDRAMTIDGVRLLHKSGGKSGTFERADSVPDSRDTAAGQPPRAAMSGMADPSDAALAAERGQREDQG
jgi:cyclic pyranopterin phosphate synthase